jgi:hypothetical protein
LVGTTIPDGDVIVTGVPVQCNASGLSGNVGAGGINSFVSAPFPTATVTNPLPFTNGTSIEDDAAYRERIRLARKSRAKATRDAVINALVGARSTDESGQITSVSTSFRAGEPRTVYIDDGTGYQEKDEGVVRETLIREALGGEKYFQLSNRPVAKAYLKTQSSAPFRVVSDSVLAIHVGGVESLHTFGETSFRDLNNASAYEVAASVNANPSLLFSARVCDSGTKVAFYATAEGNEDLLLSSSTVDANSWLNLPDAHAYTLYLYKNGELLFEDGRLASIQSKPQGLWSSIFAPPSAPMTMDVTVDGIAQTFSFEDADFIAAETGYITASHTNSLQSWAKVLNYKIPGLTATVSGGALVLTSNLGRNNRAEVAVTGGDLGAAMFSIVSRSTGLTSDYILDRNSGQLKLSEALEAGDSLVAGSASTNAYLSTTVDSLVIGSSELWFAVDGDIAIRNTGLGVGSTLTWSAVSGEYQELVSATDAFGEVQDGDWMIVTDSASTEQGLFRVARVPSVTTIVFQKASITPATFNLAEGGIAFVRCSNEPVKVEIPASTYSAASLAADPELFDGEPGL